MPFKRLNTRFLFAFERGTPIKGFRVSLGRFGTLVLVR